MLTNILNQLGKESMKQTPETIVLLNFGCEDIQKFARAIRDRHIYTMVMPYTVPAERVTQEAPAGLIVCADAGVPASPEARAKFDALKLPTLDLTGGIGGKTAEVLGRAGYEVIVTGIDEAGRDTVMSNLESKGIKAHFYKCDATSEEQVNETFAKIAEKFDHLDLLVNNVGGLGGRQRVSEMETGFMRKVMALNFDSLFFNTRAALPLLKKKNTDRNEEKQATQIRRTEHTHTHTKMKSPHATTSGGRKKKKEADTEAMRKEWACFAWGGS